MVHEHMAEDLAELETRLVRLAERERRSSQPVVFFSYPEDYLRSYAGETSSVADEDPRTTALEALWIYLDLLARRNPTFDGNHPAHELLRWAGLARCDQTGVLRSRSPLLERFYTPDWARQLRRSVESSRLWTGAPRTPNASSRTRTKRRELPRVCILTTGGTIGMVEDATGKVRAPSASEELDAAYGQVDRIAEVEYVSALDGLRDSANIVPQHWSVIAQRVAERVADRDVAGVVVTHGTDTLSYTASAVAYALGERLTKPVVFTGSQATVDVVHGDALTNLLRACKVAAEAGTRLPEVVVCFGDKVLRACRAQKKDDRRFDAFESPLHPPLAVIAEEIDYNHGAIRRHVGTPPPLDLRADFDSRILTIAQVPGLRPRLLEPVLDAEKTDEGLRGVLIQSLGAGNLPTEAGYSLVSFIDKAVERDIPVVLGSPYPVLTSNPEKYAPAEAAIRAGALPLFNITLPALVTKLAWTLGGMPQDLDHADPRQGLRRAWVHERIRTNYVGETDDQVAHLDFDPSEMRDVDTER
jgi:L-asparaginase